MLEYAVCVVYDHLGTTDATIPIKFNKPPKNIVCVCELFAL